MEQTTPTGNRVKWHRTPLDKETLARLNTKSDMKGFAQSLGHLGLLAITGSGVLYGAGRWPLWVVLAILFFHGTIAAFMINAVHELDHKSVFKTQMLNDFFAKVFGFIGWIHPEHFYNSHMRHHQFTLHQPDDLEVVLPIKVLTKHFFQFGFIHIKPWEAITFHIKTHRRLARGQFEGEWENKLYPANEPKKAEPIKRWAKTLIIGHALVLLVSLACGVLLSPVWFLVPVLTSLTPLYGGWLFFLCNNTQHIGLQDGVPDFRLCCRTFTVNPFVQFLYWHMNFHIEHHMYAAVPCYNLKKLHRAIQYELPPTPHGLIAVWKEIAAIQKKQDEDPTYQYIAPVPEPRRASLDNSPQAG